jgi:hypothetical protein
VIAPFHPEGATWRALAYDPNGNGGAGSIWTIDFGSALYEVDLAGNLLNRFPNQDSWSVYGLALDPDTGNLWAHHRTSCGTGCGAQPNIWEIDTTTGRWTGVQFESDGGVVHTGRVPPLPVQGGLSGVPGGAGGSGNQWDVVAIQQATPDSMVAFEIIGGGGCVGDINGDGRTDLADLGILLADFGCVPPGPCDGDINGDGVTDLADLGILLADFGCGP